ncbi:MAG: hypothetical protein V2A58_18375 [Planctomycetota bacterium]
MGFTGRSALCIFTAAVAVCLLAVMFFTGRTREPLAWAAVGALGVVTAALLPRSSGQEPSEPPPGLPKVGRVTKTGRVVTQQRIVLDINGERREYNSLDEVPPEQRAMLERMRKTGGNQITVTVDGEERTYRSLEEAPPKVRKIIEEMRRLREGQ